jgi:hypothetical protein
MRDENIAQARQILAVAAATATHPEDEAAAGDATTSPLPTPCPCCGGRMIVIETFEAGCHPPDHQDRHIMTVRPCICRSTEHRRRCHWPATTTAVHCGPLRRRSSLTRTTIAPAHATHS